MVERQPKAMDVDDVPCRLRNRRETIAREVILRQHAAFDAPCRQTAAQLAHEGGDPARPFRGLGNMEYLHCGGNEATPSVIPLLNQALRVSCKQGFALGKDQLLFTPVERNSTRRRVLRDKKPRDDFGVVARERQIPRLFVEFGQYSPGFAFKKRKLGLADKQGGAI